MTWEPTDNLSEDLIRDFEEGFWQACKAGKMEILEPALQYGGETMANITDSDLRTPLHFAAALDQKDLTAKLLDAGARALSIYQHHQSISTISIDLSALSASASAQSIHQHHQDALRSVTRCSLGRRQCHGGGVQACMGHIPFDAAFTIAELTQSSSARNRPAHASQGVTSKS